MYLKYIHGRPSKTVFSRHIFPNPYIRVKLTDWFQNDGISRQSLVDNGSYRTSHNDVTDPSASQGDARYCAYNMGSYYLW
jgi:hypothetical protein